jgi:hypothetical protein
MELWEDKEISYIKVLWGCEINMLTRYHALIVFAVLFTVAKVWKQPVQVNRWMDKKMWYTYTMEYYAASEKKEIWLFVTVWVNLKDIILSKISQIRNDKYVASFICEL